MVLIILIFAGLLPFAVVGLCLATSYKVALSFYGLSGLVAGIATSLATAPIQLTASAQARAQSIAVGGFLLAVIGAGGGPFFVGFLTDHLFGDPSAVGQSLALVAVASAVAGLPLMFVAWRRAKSLAATVQLEAGQ